MESPGSLSDSPRIKFEIDFKCRCWHSEMYFNIKCLHETEERNFQLTPYTLEEENDSISTREPRVVDKVSAADRFDKQEFRESHGVLNKLCVTYAP